jgi:hypothetical protein
LKELSKQTYAIEKNGDDRLPLFRVAPNLQFLKRKQSMKHNNVKYA